jgi:hypothetical protein
VVPWRRLALAALAAGTDAERRQTGEVRKALLADLQRAAKAAFKRRFPAPEADWPRFSAFLRLSEDYATSSDAWRASWTAALDRAARELLARLTPDDPEPPRSAAAAGGEARRPWWDRD